ncbi:MAG: hypothetical protein LPK80_01115 [Bacteroidota bacterium]|nr:hypothetical protein [Bacteroidota bacterium]
MTEPRIRVLILTLFLSTSAFGQYIYSPLSREYDRLQDHPDFESHASIFPRLQDKWEYHPDTTMRILPYTPWWKRALFHEHFIQVRTKDFDLSIDPLLDLRIGQDIGAEQPTTYQNTRGVYLQGRIGKEVTFFSSFTENQARFPAYYHTIAADLGVVPGEGKWRGFKETDYDYSNVQGAVTYAPGQFFRFTVGQGKNFFGDGYRSFFLSDAAFNYPYLKIETTVWKIKYINLWSQMLDLRNSVQVNDQYRRKFTSMHMLSFQATERWNFQLFEAVVYRSDTMNRGIEVSYFNPVILYRPVEFANRSSAANVLLGFGTSYQPWKGAKLYGQIILDEFVLKELRDEPGSWRNKYAFQLGYFERNAFKVKNLDIRLEYNYARPYTFQHDRPLSNYAHYAQPLAHPWGANLWEGLFQLNYQYQRWVGSAHFSYGLQGLDVSNENWGGDPYKPYDTREQSDNNKVGQGNRFTRTYMEGSIAYIVNPAYNLRVEAGGIYRRTTIETTFPGSNYNPDPTLYFYLGLRTGLFNRYYDL